MADIELVIKIPEEYYKSIKDDAKKFLSKGMKVPSLYEIVIEGTQLPKGHGDLIDRNVAREAMMFEMSGTGYQSRAMNVIDRDFYTPTIIEADEEEELELDQRE